MNIPRINLIQEERTRNLLRGLLGKDFDDRTLRTYNRLRSTTSFDDIAIVSELLLHSPLFAHLPLAEDFPSVPISAESVFRLNDQLLANELFFQGARIRKNVEKIMTAADAAIHITDLLAQQKFEDARIGVEDFIKQFGYSNFILRKLAYLYSRKNLPNGVDLFCKSELEKYGLSRRNIIALGMVDMMGETYEFLPLRRNLLEFIGSAKNLQFSYDLVSWMFRPVRASRTDLSSQIQSHGLSSLFDVYIFICIHNYNCGVFSNLGLYEVADEAIGPLLKERWQKLSSVEPYLPQADDDEPEFSDFRFYRESLAWIENAKVTQFRNGVDPYFLDPKDRDIAQTEESKDFTLKYFKNCKEFENLAYAPKKYKINIEEFDTRHAGVFSRTVGFMYLLRKGEACGSLDKNQFLTILNGTRDIALVATPGELRDFSNRNGGDALFRYLSEALIADSSGSNIDQHRLRRALQDIILHWFNGDLIDFLDYLFCYAPYVALHLYNLCTEGFLSQLFILIPESSAVFEIRAKLHDWYADRFNEPSAKERAKALRIDQRLQKIRGEIDDTRIYVDPLRFTQWVEDKLMEELSSVLRTGGITAQEIDAFHEFGDFATKRQPVVRLAVVLQAAFQEFCANKRYGIDSYLGRRIRHGTLKGFMIAQVDAILRKEKYRRLFENIKEIEYILEWRKRYSDEIDRLALEIFQVLSKEKPRGAVIPSILHPVKLVVARTALRDIVVAYEEHSSLALVAQVIMEYCWRLVEKDLLSIRALVEESRSQWGMLQRSKLKVSDEYAALASELCREINMLTDERFQTVARWFTKPTNLSPSAPVSLLFQAVIEEVKEHFPEYAPSIRKKGLADIELFGVTYHHLYDFLYVVIYNAAKHGRHDGILVQGIDLAPATGNQWALSVTVASQICAGESLAMVQSNIEMAMSGGIEDAMVIEGRSGIKKLMRMEVDVKEIESISADFEGDKVIFRCVMNLPRT